MSGRDLAELDRAASARIRAYYREIFTGQPDEVLSEDDALSASMHGDQVFLDHTDWPATECNDRALDLAFKIKDELLARRDAFFQATA